MCKNCIETNNLDEAQVKVFREAPIDPVKLAKYLRAKKSGKLPADPAYAAHVRASWHVPNLEFTAAELKDKSVKVYTRTLSKDEKERRTAPDRQFPTRWGRAAEYVRTFERLNNLKSTA